MALLANGTSQKGKGLSLKKGKEKRKKKKPKLDDVCHNCGDLGYWRDQLACPKCKEQEGQCVVMTTYPMINDSTG